MSSALFRAVFCVGLASAMSCASAPRLHFAPSSPRAAYYNAASESRGANPFEKALLDSIARHVAAQKRAPLGLDPALSKVAREYGRAVLSEQRRPPSELLDFLMGHYGVTEPHPLVFHATFPVAVADAFPERFASQLPKLLAQPATEVGLASLKLGENVGVTLIVLSRAARLEPLPQVVSKSAVLPIKGKLAAGFSSPTLMITTPAGKTEQAALPTNNGSFSASLPLRAGSGQYTVEILATGPLGPTVVSLFPVYCGVTPPARFVAKDAPAGSGLNAAASLADARAAEEELLRLINEERRQTGLAPLRENKRLVELARSHSLDMQRHGFVGHRSPSTGTLSDRLRKAGVHADVSLENIARNDTVAGAHRGLMRSPGHRRNILDPRVREIGIGVVVAGDTLSPQIYVTQNFLLPLSVVDPLTARADVWTRLRELRRGEGLPAFEHEETLDRVASLAAERILSAGSIDGPRAQAAVAAELAGTGFKFKTLTANFFIARTPGEPLDAGVWRRLGRHRAGIGVAQRPTSAFGEYALCIVLLLADGDRL